MRDARTRRANGFHVRHEARKVLERVPEFIELVRRPIDDHAARHPDARRLTARQFSGAIDVERRHAEHACRRQGDASLVRARRRAGSRERRDVDGVTRDAGPYGGGGSRSLAEDQEPADQLAHAVDADQSRVFAVAGDKSRNQAGREDLRKPERNAEPGESVREARGTFRRGCPGLMMAALRGGAGPAHHLGRRAAIRCAMRIVVFLHADLLVEVAKDAATTRRSHRRSARFSKRVVSLPGLADDPRVARACLTRAPRIRWRETFRDRGRDRGQSCKYRARYLQL